MVAASTEARVRDPHGLRPAPQHRPRPASSIQSGVGAQRVLRCCAVESNLLGPSRRSALAGPSSTLAPLDLGWSGSHTAEIFLQVCPLQLRCNNPTWAVQPWGGRPVAASLATNRNPNSWKQTKKLLACATQTSSSLTPVQK